MQQKAQALLDRLVKFGVDAAMLARAMRREIIDEHFALQLTRSATSAAANYAEACDAESRKDFVNKMRVALKELREASVWLRMAHGIAPQRQFDTLIAEAHELISIMVASVKTAQAKARSTEKTPR